MPLGYVFTPGVYLGGGGLAPAIGSPLEIKNVLIVNVKKYAKIWLLKMYTWNIPPTLDF